MKNDKLVYYIAGPMTGTEDMGRARFNAMEARLRDMGLSVLNPACLPLDMPPARYMPICLAMVREADGVVMLSGWMQSAGASIEYHYAVRCGKTIIEERDLGIGEVHAIKPVEYKQTDPRWANNMYSSHEEKHQTMKSSGSGPTVCADIVATLKDSNVTPWTLAQLALEWGDRTYSCGTAWPFFQHVADHYKFCKFVQSEKWDDAMECLDAGGYVVCSIRTDFFTGRKTGGHSNYYCIWKYSDKHVYYLAGEPTSRYIWNKKDAIDNVKQYFCFYPNAIGSDTCD